MSRRQVFGSLCATVFFVNLGRVVFAPLLEPLRLAFGASPAAIGAVASAAWVGSALPRIPTGYLLTRYDRHHVVAFSGTVLAVASFLTPLARTIPTLVGGAFLMGLSSGSYFIAANPLLSELFPGRVGRVMGAHGMAGQLAAVAGPGIVTAALAVGNWRTTFHWMAVATVAATGAFVLLSRRADLPDAGTDDRALWPAIRAQWRLVGTAVLAVGATAFVWQGVFNFYVTYLKHSGFSAGTGNLLLSVTFGAGVPAFLVTGRLADELPRVPLFLAIVGGFVASLLALTVVDGLLAVGLTSAALGYAIHSLFPAVDTYLLASLPDRHRASAYAAYSASMMAVQAGGSWVVGVLVEYGLSYAQVFRGFALALGVVLVALLGAYRVGRLPAGARP